MAQDTSVNMDHKISGQRPSVADERGYGAIATELGAQRLSSLYRVPFVLCCFFQLPDPRESGVPVGLP